MSARDALGHRLVQVGEDEVGCLDCGGSLFVFCPAAPSAAEVCEARSGCPESPVPCPDCPVAALVGGAS